MGDRSRGQGEEALVRRRAALACVALASLLAGCTIGGPDDETAPPPTRTVTASPSASLPPAPATIPVGHGDVGPSDTVWAQGSVLHVGRRAVDLSPTDVGAMVVVPGGVFVLAEGELWFTDLTRIRGTGQTDVTGVTVSEDADRLVVVDTRAGKPLAQGYDTATGRAVRGDVDTLPPAEVVNGPGRFRVQNSSRSARVVDSAGRTLQVAGLPEVLEVGAWTSDSTFLGLAGPEGGERSVVRCDLTKRRCATAGRAQGTDRVVFGTGR
jgi:hypothetical protein